MAGPDSSWAGRAFVRGSSETMCMLLLTICVAGLQFTWICTPFILLLILLLCLY
ncbi:uncharacterized protein V2V93DRAFT_367492 [Kockiozyma suomiensis]|uniref:uncharacterized protein n=1 Tax=Kockiozyma suomiensis TaxID=1337062 RepID=UPI003343FE5F